MSILHSKRSGMYIYEQTKIMMKDEKVTFIETKKATQNFISIPVKNTQFIVLTSGCSITSAAVKRLAENGVSILFASGGGTPVFMTSNDEYRPTEYMQKWASIFFDDNRRLSGAKQLQKDRIKLISEQYKNQDFLKHINIEPHLGIYSEKINSAKDNYQLLSAEGEFTRKIYGILSREFAFDDFKRDHGKKDSQDLVNSYLDYGNYLAYGMGASTLYALGISYAFPLNHGKTRRGALVFDIADVIKDAVIMPIAFYSAYTGEADNEFRKRCVANIYKSKASDKMFSSIKNICENI